MVMDVFRIDFLPKSWEDILDIANMIPMNGLASALLKNFTSIITSVTESQKSCTVATRFLASDQFGGN